MKFVALIVLFLFKLGQIDNLHAAEVVNFENEEVIALQDSDSLHINEGTKEGMEDEGITVLESDTQKPRRRGGIGWHPLEDRQNIPHYLNIAVGLTIYVFFMIFTTDQLNVN